AYVDIDDTIRRTYGYAKQGAGYGYSKVKGLNALLGIVSTPLSAPVIAATRLRKGPSNSARGAAAFVAETIRTARACGASGLLVMRADSAFYGADVVNSCPASSTATSTWWPPAAPSTTLRWPPCRRRCRRSCRRPG
ncbi:hypothetical protein ACFU9C_50890, partial [Streptomyces sp. NPDC057580]